MSIIRMLETEEEVARTYATTYKLTAIDKEKYILQRIDDRIWVYVQSLGVMPLQSKQTREDLFNLYMKSKSRCDCQPPPEPDPCKCTTRMIFQQGCQCGGV